MNFIVRLKFENDLSELKTLNVQKCFCVVPRTKVMKRHTQKMAWKDIVNDRNRKMDVVCFDTIK